MKLSLYNSLLTSRKTMLVAAFGKCGHAGYREVQIMRVNGKFRAIVTDGYRFLTGYYYDDNLKIALNWGRIVAKTFRKDA